MNTGYFSHDEMLLDTEEFSIVDSRNTEKNKLSFAVMLKFFNKHGYFFDNINTVREEMILILAKQLAI